MKLIKVEDYIKGLEKKLGDGYVYAVVYKLITVDVLKDCQARFPTKMGEGYFHKNGDYTKGKCAKWLGKYACDCSGLVESTYTDLTGEFLDKSAQGFYDMCVKKIAVKDAVRGDALFRADAKGNIVHVGIYLGNNVCIESQGVAHGVVKNVSSKRGWTHAGKLPFIDYTPVVVKDTIDIEVEKAFSHGVITNKVHWEDVLRGKTPVVLGNLVQLFKNFNDRLESK